MKNQKLASIALVSSMMFSVSVHAFDITTFSVRGVSLGQHKEAVDKVMIADYGDESVMHSIDGSSLSNPIPYECSDSESGASNCTAQFKENEPGGEFTSMVRYEAVSTFFNEAGSLYNIHYTTHVRVADNFESCISQVNGIVSKLKAEHPNPTFDNPLHHKIENRSMKQGYDIIWMQGKRKDMESYAMKIGCVADSALGHGGIMGIETSLRSNTIMFAAKADKTKSAARY